MKAWYFSGEDKRLRYGDAREIVLGETHTIEGAPELCERGLHGSTKIIDALGYAPGPIVWRVELSGDMDIGSDKIAAQSRTYIDGGVNIEHILRKFARKCALDVVNLWDAPDIVVEYLKTGDEGLRAAARDAARDAAWAAWDAARDAAWAARDADRDAVRAAAWDAARDAAWDAAWAAARAADRDAVRAAAWDAVRAADRDAARAKQNKRLTAMVSRAIKRRTI
jgi:hypothetical protein